MLIRISRPRRGSLALVLLHAWAWLEKLFLGPEAGQQARKEKKLFRPQRVLFSIARGQSAGKEGKKTFQAPKSFIFYRQRPVSRQGKNKLFRPQKVLFSIARGRSAGKEKTNFSGPKKFYFLLPEAGQQARKEKKLFRPQKVLFSIARGRSAGKEGKKNFSGPKKFYFLLPEAGQQARKEKKKLFRPQKVLFSIARGQSAGKEGKKTFQAPKSFIFYRQRAVSRQGRKKTVQAPKSFIFYRQRPASCVDGCRSSRIQSCSRRALHLCDNVRDVTTQAQEAQRPIRLRFKNPCKRPWIVEKKLFGSWKVFFPWGWTLERRPTSYFLPSN